MFLSPILIPVANSSSLEFLMMCSAYRLNKQHDSRQPCRTPFSILSQSVVSYRVLTVASWPAYRFLSGQVRWSGYSHLSKSFLVYNNPHKGSSIVDETEIDIFLKFSCFLYNPANVGNLISGFSSFSKPSLAIWNFLVHILLKPSLKDFEHFALLAHEMSTIVW